MFAIKAESDKGKLSTVPAESVSEMVICTVTRLLLDREKLHALKLLASTALLGVAGGDDGCSGSGSVV